MINLDIERKLFEEWLESNESNDNFGVHKINEYRSHMCWNVWQARAKLSVREAIDIARGVK